MISFAALLVGCLDGGGGSSAPASGTLSGVAAVGSPIASGSINVVCSAGNALTTTTSNTGAWEVTLSGQTLPCAVQVSGGTINGATNTTPYHSVATTVGTVNVTPLTDLMVANLAGAATPGAWFSGLNTSPATLNAITQTNVDAALSRLRSALSGLAPLNTFDPIGTVFTAVGGNIGDDMLEALRTAMTDAALSYSALLSNAATPSFNVVSGFNNILATAYAGTASGSSGGGGSSGGTYTLTVTVTASGIAAPPIAIQNVPKPANQTAFCGDVNVTEALNSAVAAGGTLTINSCTFNGTTGSISATLSITTPISMTIPYTVAYTYN